MLKVRGAVLIKKRDCKINIVSFDYLSFTQFQQIEFEVRLHIPQRFCIASKIVESWVLYSNALTSDYTPKHVYTIEFLDFVLILLNC